MTMGIYAITQASTGRQYIGQAKDIADRWRFHRYQLERNKHHSRFLQRVYNQVGLADLVFSVVEEVADAVLLNEREQHYLDTLRPIFNGSPTAGSPLGVKRSAETRQRWSEKRKGVPWTPERRAKYRYTEKHKAYNARRKGQPVSEKQYAALTKPTPARLAHIQKLVELQKGRPASEHRREAIRKAQQERAARIRAEGGHVLSEAQIEGNARRRGVALTPEHRAKVAEGLRRAYAEGKRLPNGPRKPAAPPVQLALFPLPASPAHASDA